MLKIVTVFTVAHSITLWLAVMGYVTLPTRLVEATIDRDELTGPELDSWLTALNELRLVLGTRLDITEESYAQWPDPRDPGARERALYLYLSGLQEEAVRAAGRGRFSDCD